MNEEKRMKSEMKEEHLNGQTEDEMQVEYMFMSDVSFSKSAMVKHELRSKVYEQKR
jgi:hypothetical protein